MTTGTLSTLALAVMAATVLAAPNRVEPAKPFKLSFADKTTPHGETRKRIERAYDRLRSTPLNDIEFVLSDVMFKYDRRFTNYSGDISGRMLGALNACDAALGQETPFIEELIQGFAKHQKPDGHFGVEQNLDKEINQLRDMALLWGNGRLLLALAERQLHKPDARVLEMAKRLGDYVISTRKYYGKKENFEGVGGIKASGFTTCYPSMIDGLAALGEVSGDRRYVEEGRFIGRLSLLHQKFKGHHSHGRLISYRGMVDVDRILGTHEFKHPVLEGRLRVLDEYVVPPGGVPEYFNRNYNRDEGCSEADWLRVSLLSWPATGNAGDIDLAEFCLRNHIHMMQFTNGGFGHGFFITLKDGDRRYPYGGAENRGSESYWCCAMHGTQVLAEMPRWGVVRREGKLLVTWLAEVSATFNKQDGRETLTVRTERTAPARWTVTVQADKPTTCPILLRVPFGATSIQVDGKRRQGKGNWADWNGVGGWVDVRREWSGKQTLEVALPDAINLEGPYGEAPKKGEPVRVFSIPDMYCLPEPQLADGLLASDAVPHIVMAAKRPKDGRIPVVVRGKEGKTQRATLVPMAARPPGGLRWLFHVERVDGKAFDRLAKESAAPVEPGRRVELEFAIDGQCSLYLNGRRVSGHGGWSEAPQVDLYSKQKENVVAIKARSAAKKPALMGMIRAGGKQWVTSAKDFAVCRVGKNVARDVLLGAKPAAGGDVEVIDVGPLGIGPFHHTPGEFLKSGARWIWAKGKFDPKRDWWLFTFRFTMPD